MQMNIWQFQSKISQRLLKWSVGSILVGFLMRTGSPFWRNMGNQFIAWGVIDAGIAIGGQVAKRNRIDHIENPGKADVKKEEADNLTRILWINAALDVIYVVGGYLWSKRDEGEGKASGNGWGIIIQGAFLLFFDIFHARNMPKNHND
ncbi:MAG: hypothetical protein AAFV98_24240 [Chloroflexota bacterium]